MVWFTSIQNGEVSSFVRLHTVGEIMEASYQHTSIFSRATRTAIVLYVTFFLKYIMYRIYDKKSLILF